MKLKNSNGRRFRIVEKETEDVDGMPGSLQRGELSNEREKRKGQSKSRKGDSGFPRDI